MGKWLTLFRKEGHVFPQVRDGSLYTLADARVGPGLFGQATAAGLERFEQRRPTRERRLRLGARRFGRGIGLAARTCDVLRYGRRLLLSCLCRAR